MSHTEQRDHAEILRDEMVMRDKIAALLTDGPKTIVEIAEALGSPAQETTIWVMAMWRYGYITASGKPDDSGYFSYTLREENAQ